MAELRAPALGARIMVAAASVAATIALVGWMARASLATSNQPAAAPTVLRRVVVVEPEPEAEPYITLEAAPAGRQVVVVTRPAQVIRRPVAAPAGATVAAPVTTSSGS